MKVRPLKGSTELPGNAPWATPCMRKGILVNTKYEKGSSLSNASWLTDIFFEHWTSPVLKKADESILMIGIATFAFMNGLLFCLG